MFASKPQLAGALLKRAHSRGIRAAVARWRIEEDHQLAKQAAGIATSRTSHLLAANTPLPEALTSGFQRALLTSAICLVVAGFIALRASNTRGEPVAVKEPPLDLEPSYDAA